MICDLVLTQIGRSSDQPACSEDKLLWIKKSVPPCCASVTPNAFALTVQAGEHFPQSSPAANEVDSLPFGHSSASRLRWRACSQRLGNALQLCVPMLPAFFTPRQFSRHNSPRHLSITSTLDWELPPT